MPLIQAPDVQQARLDARLRYENLRRIELPKHQSLAELASRITQNIGRSALAGNNRGTMWETDRIPSPTVSGSTRTTYYHLRDMPMPHKGAIVRQVTLSTIIAEPHPTISGEIIDDPTPFAGFNMLALFARDGPREIHLGIADLVAQVTTGDPHPAIYANDPLFEDLRDTLIFIAQTSDAQRQTP